MSGMDLEEGEALPRFSNFDETIDPDKDFSYIDKKIQDVLGQYQRDFMGGVSVENLGARFDYYGSFLSAYEHSPSTLAHPRNQSHLSSRSANNIPLEGPALDSVQTNDYVPGRISSSNYYEVKSFSASRTDEALQSSLVPGTEDATLVSVKETFSTDSRKHQISGEYIANKESRCLPRNGAIENPLKFRVKVVSDSLLPRDNSAIYSGLGLDISPSTSLEDSPSEVDEASPSMREMPEDSPSCIIEIMTSFPVPAGKIISPLHGSLLHLVEYQSKLENGIPDPHQVGSLTVAHGSPLSQSITEVRGEVKFRLTENNVEVGQSQKENHEGQIDASCPSLISGVKKQGVSKMSDLAVPMEKLSASGHSCVSNGKDEVGYLEEVSGKSLKHRLVVTGKEKEFRSDSASFDLKDKERKIGVGSIVKKGNASSVSRNDVIFNEVNEDSSTDSIKLMSQRGSVKRDKREEIFDSVPLPDSDVTDEKQPNRTEKISKNKKAKCPLRKDAKDNSEIRKVNHDVTQGIKDHNSELLESSIEKLDLKGVPSYMKGTLPKGRQYSSSGGRKKSKESQIDGTELPDLSSRLSSSPAQAEAPVLRIKFPSKGGKDDFKPHIESWNLKDTLDEMHSDSDLMKKEKIKDSKNSMQRFSMGVTRPSNAKVKEKSGNKISESYSNAGPNLIDDPSISNPSTEIASASDALQTHNACESDNWVQCEICHTWRLLPSGLLPDCLPKIWICRMLDWLPGMNKCSFSEDETANALRAQYQIHASVPEKQNIQPDYSKGGAPMYASVGLQHGVGLGFSRILEPPSLVENSHVQQLQHYTENEQQHSVGLGNPKKLSQSNDDLNFIRRNAEVNPFKKEKKRKADHDACGAQKKVKRVQQQSNKEQSPAGVVSRGDRDGQNRSTRSSEVSKEKLSGSLSTSIKKIKDKVHGTINTVQHQGHEVSGKKRKLTNEFDSMSYREFSDWKEKILMDNQPVANRVLRTEVNKGSEHMGGRNKKRSKGIELQEKELFTRTAHANDNGARCKDASAEDMPLAQRHGSNISHKSPEVRKSSKKDTEPGLPSAIAATCNSSRLSSPCKVKVKHREMKSSPAGSISSSPLKVLRDHDMHMDPEDLFSAKRLNSGPPDEIIRCVKSGIRTSVTNYDHDDENLFAMSIGEDKQLSSVKHHTEHGIEKQLKHDVVRDAHSKSECPIAEHRFGASHQHVSPREPGKSVNLSDRVKLKNLVPSGSKRGNRPRLSQCVSASEKGDGCVTTEIDNCDAKVTKQPVDGEVPNSNVRDGDDGLTHSVRHNRGDGTAADDIEPSSSLKKDSSQNPAQLLKEAKELKHTADRLKKTSSMRETAVVVFQAALKFLIGASLVEPVRTEIGRTAGMISPTEVCKTTADYCEHWAREFERCNDMALAALAYKCMEVACMRVVYCNDVAANRDQHELLVALRSVPQVDSPSSSASDVDNLNHQAVISSVKDLHLPVVHGNHVMPAGTLSSLGRLLNFTRDVHRGMEATRKSQRAFTDARSNLSKAGKLEFISSLKRVLDFGFHDLGGLLRIVSLAMEALGG